MRILERDKFQIKATHDGMDFTLFRKAIANGSETIGVYLARNGDNRIVLRNTLHGRLALNAVAGVDTQGERDVADQIDYAMQMIGKNTGRGVMFGKFYFYAFAAELMGILVNERGKAMPDDQADDCQKFINHMWESHLAECQ